VGKTFIYGGSIFAWSRTLYQPKEVVKVSTKRPRTERVKRHIERRFVQRPDKQEHAPEEIKAANQVEGDYISLKQLDRFVSRKINEVQ